MKIERIDHLNLTVDDLDPELYGLPLRIPVGVLGEGEEQGRFRSSLVV